MKQYDVIVIGLGAMGSSTAYHFARLGYSVLGIEQYSLAHALGSSHGETRLIRQAYFEHPSYVPLLKRCYTLWEELEKVSGKKLFHKTGLTIFGSKESEILKGVRESSRQHSIPIQEFSHQIACEKYPQFNIPEGFGGILEPAAGYLEVEKCVQTYCEEAEKLGAELKFETRVAKWSNESNQFSVQTDKGSFTAKYGVFSAGAWTNQLLDNLPLKVHRVPQFWFKQEDQKHPDSFAFDMEYGFMYGFPEIGGLIKVAAHLPGALVSDPSLVVRTISPEDSRLVEKFVSAQLKGVGVKPQKASVCLYTLTPDQFFIVDFVKANPNIAMAAGFSGHGFKFASVIGEVMTQLLLKGKKGCGIDFLSLSRFSI